MRCSSKLPEGDQRRDEISVGHGYGSAEQSAKRLARMTVWFAYGARGNQYGQAYLERYGEHIGSLVLDGWGP
jgi:hypothetical protein